MRISDWSSDVCSSDLADQREDLSALIVNARKASEQLNTTLDSTNRAISDVDREFVQKLPGLIDRLDSTLAKLDSAAGGADQILSANRAAIRSFANDGLSHLGPTLAELRTLILALRRLRDRLQGHTSRSVPGRHGPKESATGRAYGRAR